MKFQDIWNASPALTSKTMFTTTSRYGKRLDVKEAMLTCRNVALKGNPKEFKYSLTLFDHFCPVKRPGEYFAKEWSE